MAALCLAGAAAATVQPLRASSSLMRSRTPRMGAFEWVEAGKDELNLLPFGLQELLLPGETKQVHLYEARFLALFEEAEKTDKGCVAMMLITPNNGVAAVTSLLEIEESRKQEIGVWARLRCVGRVRLAEVEQTDYGYVRAQVSLVSDGAPDDVDVDEDTLSECLEAHAACNALQVKLMPKWSGSDDSAEGESEESGGLGGLGGLGGIGGLGGAADERVEFGHEAASGSIGFEMPLPKVLDQKREMLCFRGLDLPPSESLDERVQKVWGARSETAAEAQLLSFAASSCLSTRDRARALLETSTLERLQGATSAFRETQRRLAAEAAMYDGLGSSDSSSASDSE